jgi:uncharacterized RDD family membrane protein YckC
VSELVTGEAVPLEMRLAKLPSRAIAFGIDLLVLLVVGTLLLVMLGLVLPTVDPALGSALTLVYFVGLIVGVPVLVETLTRGRSLGKLVLGLRVVRDDGGPVRFRHALTRALAGVFVDFYVTSGAGAVICSLLNERGKRVGDILAGTVVVRERAPAQRAPLLAAPPQLAAWATTLELSRLPGDLALAARGYLARYSQLSPRVRDEMGIQLATEISRTITPPAPPGTPAWAYLAAVLSERGRRESLRLSEEAQSRARYAQPPSTAAAAEPTVSRTKGADEEQTASGWAREEQSTPGGFAPPS